MKCSDKYLARLENNFSSRPFPVDCPFCLCFFICCDTRVRLPTCTYATFTRGEILLHNESACERIKLIVQAPKRKLNVSRLCEKCDFNICFLLVDIPWKLRPIHYRPTQICSAAVWTILQSLSSILEFLCLHES